MGIKHQKDTQIFELNVDFIYEFNPQILTHDAISEIITGNAYNKSTILLPAKNIQILEGGKLEISLKSESVFEKGLIKKECLISNYFIDLFQKFQICNYLEFAIAIQENLSQYVPNNEIKEFYKKYSQLNKSFPIQLKKIQTQKDLTSHFEISPIKTKQELERFQTSNQPKQFYLSLGRLVQRNPKVNLDPKLITQMSLEFLDNLSKLALNAKIEQMKTSVDLKGKNEKPIKIRSSLEFKLDKFGIPKMIL